MPRSRKRQLGTAIVEFAVAAAVPILMVVATMQICLAMWSYETLQRAVSEGTRYSSTKGPGCSYTGNSCTVSIGTITSRIASTGIALNPASLNVTLTSTAGSVSCAPITTCYTNTALWPPSTVNQGSAISITATYPVSAIIIPGGGGISSSTVSATSGALVMF